MRAASPFKLSCFNSLRKKQGNVKAIQLTTTAPSRLSATDLHNFLSRPANWPQIVASSDSVTAVGRKTPYDTNTPLKPGISVEEFFGLGLLSVTWTCRRSSNKKGSSLLVVESPEGVPGVATDCRMSFDLVDEKVQLTMDYEPQSFLAVLATPVLVVDNWIALNALLPAAVDRTPLASFTTLMGRLYGVAGLAHAADLWLGDSTLFVTNNIPAWTTLPPSGQALATVWCAAGPVAWWMTTLPSRFQPNLASSGLISYGAVELCGSWLSGQTDVLQSAAGVQAIVAAAWVYSYQKQKQQQEQQR